MLFGAPFSTTRSFDKHFASNKSNENYLFHIFKTLSVELRGDAILSASLYSEYLTRVVAVRGVKIQTMAGSSDEDILLRLQDQTLTQKVFITMFDVLCKGRFFSCLAQWNNYSKELVEHEDLVVLLTRQNTEHSLINGGYCRVCEVSPSIGLKHRTSFNSRNARYSANYSRYFECQIQGY